MLHCYSFICNLWTSNPAYDKRWHSRNSKSSKLCFEKKLGNLFSRTHAQTSAEFTFYVHQCMCFENCEAYWSPQKPECPRTQHSKRTDNNLSFTAQIQKNSVAFLKHLLIWKEQKKNNPKRGLRRETDKNQHKSHLLECLFIIVERSFSTFKLRSLLFIILCL